MAFHYNELRYVMRWIEPGTFMMGSPDAEANRYHNEILHQVTFTEGFWLGATTVPQALWQEVMGENPSRFKGKERPVEQVSWEDVQNFIDQLNITILGLDLVLPSEAQWEYACRAGTDTPFSFGSNIRPKQVNYDGNYPYADGKKGRYRAETVDVKALPCNQWGLYQMHGNVREWCQDWYGDSSKEPINPRGPDMGHDRVYRSGSWDNGAKYCRSAIRSGFTSGHRSDWLGFRLARSRSGKSEISSTPKK
ncbi:MAG: formylglycine-generating enzyme family protein [Candidatus Electrothrix sp. AR4]|nr:formylglycine-generating enzyme family protein [Candidatus Electrothrix sp. AR4]